MSRTSSFPGLSPKITALILGLEPSVNHSVLHSDWSLLPSNHSSPSGIITENGFEKECFIFMWSKIIFNLMAFVAPDDPVYIS